jgi:chorismate mutase/prephenate dehydrogenase
LDDLRAELSALDAEILRLVTRRQAVSQEIGVEKRAQGKSTRDYAQERTVIERAEAEATRLGLSPKVARELLLLLINSSLTIQEQDRVAAGGSGGGRRILIIGGRGQMGQWFARFLGSQGYVVEIADPAGPVDGFSHVDDYKKSKCDHDIVIVAAHLAKSNEILLDLADNPPPGVIFDIGSLKSPLRTGLLALAKKGARVCSIHPMFGPNTELLSGRHVIFCDVGHKEAMKAARELFAETMATQVEMNIDDHDRLIAYVLGLSHALNIAFFTALAESGETAPKLAQMSSTTFDAQLAIAQSVAQESPALYFEIQSLNDYGTESLSALLYAVERLRTLVRAGDAQGFAALMKKGNEYLSGRKKLAP